ncbi:MAG: 2-(1,2-epoxy,2-dihydrophenyl)acetyl-CoA isomerase [Actinomycetota bacterium]|nr:2-(1,2-epoxy,2-dihydrophenyl)acetyl-CoA isomerase [Actinomycetota bacterium]
MEERELKSYELRNHGGCDAGPGYTLRAVSLRLSTEEGVAAIILDRPEVMNALNQELGLELLDAVSKSAADEQVRCIVLSGAGRAFCAGEDLGALAETYERGDSPGLGQTLIERYNPLIRAIREAPKPVVAALNGVAAGAGASIALACDFRIASEHAKLVLAFIKVGLVPDSGAIWFLTRMVGAAKAWELAATGEPLSAQDALGLHLVNRVVAADAFEEEWKAFARGLATGPTRAFALTKSLLGEAATSTLDEQLDLEVEAQAEVGRTSDHLEGVRAFLAKRAPRFWGM